MRIKSHLIIIFLGLTLIPSAFADVELCSRKAKILGGLVSHYWIKTPTVEAGMGPADLKPSERLGENRVDGLFTRVYVVDHSHDTATQCTKIEVDNEECVEKKLELGKYLGRFSPINNCFFFAIATLRQCGAHGEAFERYYREPNINSDNTIGYLQSPSCNNIQSCTSKMNELSQLTDPLSNLADLEKESTGTTKSELLETQLRETAPSLPSNANALAD
jgi:hypothetical protein